MRLETDDLFRMTVTWLFFPPLFLFGSGAKTAESSPPSPRSPSSPPPLTPHDHATIV
ncbi:hypothetical protein IF1G_01402 [Cordyceps javanica]|uniref:Uncharacterized protein n=1 Tax=Cordyceps javanica TaxID=43265 RepID=A0A545VBU4_9HYPO|nr:hypothetical protein IF1G_01402 [Cordyceps javanica]